MTKVYEIPFLLPYKSNTFPLMNHSTVQFLNKNNRELGLLLCNKTIKMFNYYFKHIAQHLDITQQLLDIKDKCCAGNMVKEYRCLDFRMIFP